MVLFEQLKQDFKLYEGQAETSDFSSLRKNAFKEFERLGFPTTKHEEWKYTNLKHITNANLQTTCAPAQAAKDLLNQSIDKSLTATRLVFVNGAFYPELSTILPEADGIIISHIAEARKTHTEIFTKHFGKYAPIENMAMNALNLALCSDGAFVYVPKNTDLENPVIVINITDTSDMPVLAQPRNLFVVETNASATFIEAYYAIGLNQGYNNCVSEIFAGENSSVEHYKLQREAGEMYQTNFTQVYQQSNTQVNQVTLTLDGKLVRNNLHFNLDGENCNTLLYGLYITSGSNLVDNHTRVDHAKPNSFSDEKYKGILKDQSVAVFNGKIMVHLDAQKTNAYQRNQNILLSDEATVNTKPQLEIFADDVKCTHGATVGQLDEEPMFYLRSRGIPEAAARKMLLQAFADDIAEKIKIPQLVNVLEQEIEKQL